MPSARGTRLDHIASGFSVSNGCPIASFVRPETTPPTNPLARSRHSSCSLGMQNPKTRFAPTFKGTSCFSYLPAATVGIHVEKSISMDVCAYFFRP